MRTWWNERFSFETKAGIVALALVGLAIGGWVAADGLGSAKAVKSTSAKRVGTTSAVRTVVHVVTVREPGKLIKERVPVIQRVYYRTKPRPAAQPKPEPPRTVYLTTTVVRTVERDRPYPVTGPTRTVTRVVTKTVEHTEWKVLTVVNPVTVTVTVPSAP
ncbi:MAG TPA: hypothetical protein VFB17_03670 [Gaiellaceae bacterium]|nr:hypothetical protein [Gaiellaceae bacterium]